MRAEVNNEKIQKPVVQAAVPAKRQAVVEDDDDVSLNLDYGVIQKFGRLNITAPIFKEDLPKCVKDLEELLLAFNEKGDEERDLAKAKFLRECRRSRGERSPPKPKQVQPSEEEDKKDEVTTLKAPSDKLKIVERIGYLKR
jgi:hypothetical protein